MDISCPNCSEKHNTKDYPDAFELQCSCGYSILLPDESDFVGDSLEQPEASDFSAAPAALEAQDEDLKIPAEELVERDSLDDLPKVSEEMTPPEDLPGEMPYDPFEVPGLEAVAEEAAGEDEAEEFDSGAMAIPSFEAETDSTEASVSSENEIVDDTFDDEFTEMEQEAEAAEAAALATEEGLDLVEEIEDLPPAPPSQKIVERAQLASMGQLLGFSYNLFWEKVDKDLLKKVKYRCIPVLEQRPWLEAEIKQRGIEISTMENRKELLNVPEALALEIYLGILELGGDCRYEKLSS